MIFSVGQGFEPLTLHHDLFWSVQGSNPWPCSTIFLRVPGWNPGPDRLFQAHSIRGLCHHVLINPSFSMRNHLPAWNEEETEHHMFWIIALCEQPSKIDVCLECHRIFAFSGIKAMLLPFSCSSPLKEGIFLLQMFWCDSFTFANATFCEQMRHGRACIGE